MTWIVRQLINVSLVALVVVAALGDREAIVSLLQAWQSVAGRVDTIEPEAEAQSEAAAGARTLRIRADRGGHFFVFANVEGKPIRFMVDTGATTVVLSPTDAARIGLQPREREFTQRFQTANGLVRAAPVTLREVKIGAMNVRDVDAVVNERPLGVSLLGLTFLRRLDGYAVQNGVLVLSW